jgi:hypothetical protein
VTQLPGVGCCEGLEGEGVAGGLYYVCLQLHCFSLCLFFINLGLFVSSK